MKIRVMGTKNECLAAREYYASLEKDSNVKRLSISDLYPNRGSNTDYRLYVEVEYYDEIIETVNAQERLPSRKRRPS